MLIYALFYVANCNVNLCAVLYYVYLTACTAHCYASAVYAMALLSVCLSGWLTQQQQNNNDKICLPEV